MHIPNGMLQGGICQLTAVISVVGISLAAFKAFFAQAKPGAGKFAAITAFVFAAQMINFPVSGGTSGHLLGGVLVAALLGIPFGILSMALVVTIQCLVFSDGGTAVLGANILNMAIIGAGLGGCIHAYFKRSHTSKAQHALGLGLSAWLAVMAASLACSIELAISGTAPFLPVIVAMWGAHSLIGIGEALITLAVCLVLAYKPVEASPRKSLTVPLIASGIIAFVLSPFASGLPDGLEWVAEKYNFLHQSAPAFVGPLPDYSVPAISNAMLTTSLAGLLGVIITFIIAWLLARALRTADGLEARA